jgi:hypothetical protein
MNTNTNRRPLSLTLSTAAVAIFVVGTFTSTAASAIASEPREQAHSVSTNSGWYGEPLAALGGDTLAQYLADHWALVIDPGV